MRKAFIVAVFPFLFATMQAGRTLHFTGRGFSFSITEPDGWLVDLESAIQIAQFVVYPAGSNWRQAPQAIFGRFVDRRREQTLESFVSSERKRFTERCPFFEIHDLDLREDSPYRFIVKSYQCPGVRHEVVAITEVPEFFVVFVLSGNSPEGLEEGKAPLKELISSFRWRSYGKESQPDAPRDHR